MKKNKLVASLLALLGTILVLFSACYQTEQKEAPKEEPVQTQKEDSTNHENVQQSNSEQEKEQPAIEEQKEGPKPVEQPEDFPLEPSNIDTKKSQSSFPLPKKEEVLLPKLKNESNFQSQRENFANLEGSMNHSSGVPQQDLSLYWDRLHEIIIAAQRFYTENYTKTRLISKDGFLYNNAIQEIIGMEYLCDQEGLDKKYRALDCNVLLLFGEDLSSYGDFGIVDNKELTLFVSCKHPTKDQYLVTAGEGKDAILSGTQYRQILKKYQQNHGEIRRMASSGDSCQRILDFIRMYESKYENYFVRKVLADDKYVSVILSTTTNVSDVKHYILEKEDTIWKVVFAGVEKQPRMEVAVNRKLPDFNLDMLSLDNLYDYRNDMRTDFDEIKENLLEQRLLGSSTDIAYIAGTTNYVYIVSQSRLHFLCIKKNDDWEITKVDSAFQAQEIMLSIASNAPIFILLDE